MAIQFLAGLLDGGARDGDWLGDPKREGAGHQESGPEERDFDREPASDGGHTRKRQKSPDGEVHRQGDATRTEGDDDEGEINHPNKPLDEPADQCCQDELLPEWQVIGCTEFDPVQVLE